MLDEEKIVSNELDVLNSTITYAENQVGYVPDTRNMNPGTEDKLLKISSGQRSAYQEYIIHAYGKAIRINTELEGDIVLRVSQSAAIFNDKRYQIATPNSPIGRLVNIARVGQEYEGKLWGEYQIIDVWQFERYRGTEAVSQRRNFSRMIGKGSLDFVLTNLKRWLSERIQSRKEQEQAEKLAKLKQEEHEALERRLRQQEEKDRRDAEEAQRKIEEEKLAVIERQQIAEEAKRQEVARKEQEALEALEDLEAAEKEDEKIEILEGIIDSLKEDLPPELITRESEPELPEPKSIGLSAWFYVNLSHNQYDAAHVGPKGLAIVEGIAGSGKTSVALGRTKSLVQLSQLPTTDERYTPDFDPQAQIGVVRTGELIQYLKDTCQELELHHFPIKEYSDIQQKLRHDWNLLGARSGSKRFRHLSNLNYLVDSETCTEWANFVSNHMADLIRGKILSILAESTNQESSLSVAILRRISQSFRNRLPLKLHGFLANLSQLMEELIDQFFNKSVWLGWKRAENSVHWFCIHNENPISLIMASPQPLCIAFNQLHAVALIVPISGLSNWRAWLPSKGDLVDKQGNSVSEFTLQMAIEDKNFSEFRWKTPIYNSTSESDLSDNFDANSLNLKNNNDYSNIESTISNIYDSPESSVFLNIRCLEDTELCNQIYQRHLAVFNGCRFVKIRGETGRYKKERFYSYKKPYQIIDASAIVRGDSNIDDNLRNLWSEARKNLRSRLISVFSKAISSPADLYIETINNKITENESIIPSDNLVNIRKRLKDRYFADVDIDHLLLLTMELLYGAGKTPVIKDSHLVEPDYYAAVFIDEVQDFTEIQVRLMSMLANPKYRAVTVVGDMGQRLHRPSVKNLKSCFTTDHWDDAHHVSLKENIRQSMVHSLGWLSSSYRSTFIDCAKNPITLPPKDNKGIQLVNLDVLAEPRGILPLLQDVPSTWSAVVVWPDQKSAKSASDSLQEELAQGFIKTQFAERLDLSKRFVIHQTIPQHIKGLEFDYLMMVGIERYNLNDVIAINEVYVCLSRPTQKLVILGQLDQLDERFAQLLSHFQS